jgi:hypothetical protein
LNRDHPWQRIDFALFSRSGFTPELIQQAHQEDVRLVGLEEMIGVS